VKSLTPTTKDLLLEIIQRLTRVEENIKSFNDDLQEIKAHISTINDEMGKLEERVGLVENLYYETKSRYDRMSLFWKAATFLLSPIITFVIITTIKILLGLPIP